MANLTATSPVTVPCLALKDLDTVAQNPTLTENIKQSASSADDKTGVSEIPIINQKLSNMIGYH